MIIFMLTSSQRIGLARSRRVFARRLDSGFNAGNAGQISKRKERR